MPSKRPLDTGPSSSAPNPAKRARRTPQAPKSAFGRPGPSANPLNPLRARIRSLKRLLAHDDAVDAPSASAPNGTGGVHPDRERLILHDADELEVAAKREERRGRKRLPAGVRVERERELRTLEGRVGEGERRKRRGEMVGRWHMVRFFDRKKAERRVKRLRREGVGEGEVGAAEVDRNYALFYPLEKAYVSLWPRREGKGKEEDDGGAGKGDRVMWALVEKCMAEGTLDELREGRVEGCGVMGPEVKTASRDAKDGQRGQSKKKPAVGGEGKAKGDGKATGEGKVKGKAARPEAADDSDSDGGFFEN